tara:strand:+ start:70 stop:402 length:333 start_codon:yes stop_codon:yes gene_type:complete
MKKEKLTRKMKIKRNQAGQESVNSKYAQKKRLRKRGIISPRSPYYSDKKTRDNKVIDFLGSTIDAPTAKIYCTVCGIGYNPQVIGLVFGLDTCVSCAKEIGEPLQSRGVH